MAPENGGGPVAPAGGAHDQRAGGRGAPRPDHPRSGPRTAPGHGPDPVPRARASAVRLLLPLRGRGQGCARAPALLHDPGPGRHGGRDPQRPDHARPEDRACAAPFRSLRRLRLSRPAGLPGRRRRPGIPGPCEARPLPGGPAADPGAQPPARRLRKGVRAEVRGGMPPQPGGRVRRDQPGEAFRVRARERPPGAAPSHGEAGCRRGGRTGGPDLRVLPVPAGPLGHDPRGDAPPGRDAPVRDSRVPSSPGGARRGHRCDPVPGRGGGLQPQARQGVHAAGIAGGGIRRDLPGSGRAPRQEAGRAGRGRRRDRIGPGFPEGHRAPRAKAAARKGRGGGGRELRRGRRTDRRPLRRGGGPHPVPPVPQGDAGLPRGSGRGGAGRSAPR